MGAAFYCAHTPDVTYEDFKNEILIIDLKTGHYHSLRGSGAHIWRLLTTGLSVERCVEWMAVFFSIDQASIKAETQTFVGELEKLGLIIPLAEPAATADVPASPAGESYEPPAIESYGDLQDLLLLDPIHEIAPDAGWPQRRENA